VVSVKPLLRRLQRDRAGGYDAEKQRRSMHCLWLQHGVNATSTKLQ